VYGSYKLVFAGFGWTPERRGMVLSHLCGVDYRVEQLITIMDQYISAAQTVCDNSSASELQKVRDNLQNLLVALRDPDRELVLDIGVNSKADSVLNGNTIAQLFHMCFGASVDRAFAACIGNYDDYLYDEDRHNPYYFGKLLSLNSVPECDFFSYDPNEVQSTLFHELLHYEGMLMSKEDRENYPDEWLAPAAINPHEYEGLYRSERGGYEGFIFHILINNNARPSRELYQRYPWLKQVTPAY